MLENPYYAAPSSGPEDAGAYQGEGRMEESEDGSSISIWWESNLEEALELNLRLQKKLGVWKVVRRSQVIMLVFGVASFLIALLLQERGAEVMQSLCIVFGLFFIVVAILRPLRFKKSLKKMVIIGRGSHGTIEVKVQIDPVGVRLFGLDSETAFYWRSIQEVEVSSLGVTFIRQLAGFVSVPTRVFPNAEAMERFVRLAQQYANPRMN